MLGNDLQVPRELAALLLRIRPCNNRLHRRRHMLSHPLPFPNRAPPVHYLMTVPMFTLPLPSSQDEVTNGLDSASALAITRALHNLCTYFQATMLVSLLQPSPEVFECFDGEARGHMAHTTRLGRHLTRGHGCLRRRTVRIGAVVSTPSGPEYVTILCCALP